MVETLGDLFIIWRPRRARTKSNELRDLWHFTSHTRYCENDKDGHERLR